MQAWRRKRRRKPPMAEPQHSASAPSAPQGSVPAARRRPGFVFFGIVAAVALLLDVTSKAWAEIELTRRSPLELSDPAMPLIEQYRTLHAAHAPDV